MNVRFEKWYDKKVRKINSLREALKANPDNEALKQVIEEEEKKLFKYVVETGKQLEKYLQTQKEESEYGD